MQGAPRSEIARVRQCSGKVASLSRTAREPRRTLHRQAESRGRGRGGMDELDSKNLGRLRRIADARSVWTSESGDFTPWLAENIDVLADALGMTLTVVDTEV